MVLRRIAFRKQDGIISPADGLFAHLSGKLAEGLQQPVLIRHVGFQIPSVRRNGNIPVLAIALQLIQIGQQGQRILGAEADAVHHLR